MALPEMQKKLNRVGSGVLYSTIGLPTTASLANAQKQFFNYGQGSIPDGLTFSSGVTETNFTTPGQLPGDKSFVCHGVALQLTDIATPKVPLTYGDLWNVIQGSMLSWKQQQTQIEICPALMAQAGGGVYGVAGTNTDIPAALNNGAGGIYRFGKPVILYPLATFSVLWSFPSYATTPGVTIAARLVFVGTYETVVAAG